MPVWQALREELHPQGIEVVTVALDTGGWDAARKSLEKANPSHPALLDQAHVCGELFGVVNVPTGIWIDEQGMIVRPAEPAWPGKAMFGELTQAMNPDDIPDERLANMLRASRRIKHDPQRYVAAVRDWVANGAESPYALDPDEVVLRSRPRPVEEGMAAARFELGQHLWRAGDADGAVRNWREAHRLQPDNWTYKRQAWTFADPLQLPTSLYEGDWLKDVLEVGPENYYPALEM